MGIYFFDTSALQHRYVDGKESRRIRRLISDKRVACYIADWTVLEIASTLARQFRNGKLRKMRYETADKRFMRDVATARLKVRVSTLEDVQRARYLIRFAGTVKKKNISSGDALIAVCCRELAFELGQKVIFFTSDWQLYEMLQQLSSYTTTLILRYIGVPKSGLSKKK